LTPLNIAAFDEDAAVSYGNIRATLEKKGEIIGSNDLLIAAHALAHNKILVTNNIREFSRVPNLILENWIIKH
jgi:tRNA(fMet)-specific endonuclease VapC